MDHPIATLYLAGPITGETWAGATSWRDTVTKALYPDIMCFSPLRAKDYLDNGRAIPAHPEGFALSTDRGIGARDAYDVRTRDGVFLNLLEAKVITVGSMIEVGMAHAWRKPLIVAMENHGNPNDHAMLRCYADFIVPTLEEAIHVVKAIFLPGTRHLASTAA